MGKNYDKPALIGTTKIEPKPDSCQQGDEASAPESTPAVQPPDQAKTTGRPSGRGHLKIVRNDPTGK